MRTNSLRHRTDGGALLSGVLLCTFGVLALLAAVSRMSFAWSWLLPGLLLGLGIAGVIGAVSRSRAERR